MLDPQLFPVHALLRTFRRETNSLKSGTYHQCTPATGLTTDATLGWNVIRVMPFVVPNRVTISRIGAEVTLAGAASSVFRLGIWADQGTVNNGLQSLSCFPGPLILDAGTIDGTSATVQELTVSQKLKPGLYWIGGAVQGGTTGTQPTLRALSGVAVGRTALTNGTTPTAAQALAPGWSYTGVTGAFPAWTGTVSPTSTCARVFVKV